MKIFQHDVDQQTLDRFEDVSERVQGLLIEYLCKCAKDFRPIALRLMILGKDEISAKPWIVVLCRTHTSKKVNRFFQKERIKSLCQPKGPNEIGFEVTTVSKTFKPSASHTPVEVYGVRNLSDATSNWSIPIRVQQENQRFATMGGIIVVTASNDRKTYYGLTAGHIVDREDILADRDIREDSGYTSQDDNDHDDSSDGGSMIDEPSSQSLVQTPDQIIESRFAVTHHSGWTRVGKITNASFSTQAINRDWAMIEGAEDLLKQPGYLRVPETHTDLIDTGTKDTTLGTDLDVALMSEVTPPRARISGLPTKVLLPAASKFVRVFTLSPGEDFSMCPSLL
jgi:hypothetical protein